MKYHLISGRIIILSKNWVNFTSCAIEGNKATLCQLIHKTMTCLYLNQYAFPNCWASIENLKIPFGIGVKLLLTSFSDFECLK